HQGERPAEATAARLGPWGTPVNLGGVVNTEFHDHRPAISKDGLSLYFGPNLPGSVGTVEGIDRYAAPFLAAGRIAIPQPAGPPPGVVAAAGVPAVEVARPGDPGLPPPEAVALLPGAEGPGVVPAGDGAQLPKRSPRLLDALFAALDGIYQAAEQGELE